MAWTTVLTPGGYLVRMNTETGETNILDEDAGRLPEWKSIKDPWRSWEGVQRENDRRRREFTTETE